MSVSNLSRGNTVKREYLIWDENRHSIGILSLDNQHKQLVRQVNLLANLIDTQTASDDELHELMSELLILAKQHFDHEEQIMSEYGYPGIDGHITEHRGLLKRLETMKSVLRTAEPHKVELVLAFITDWAELHLLQGEKELGAFLASKGLS